MKRYAGLLVALGALFGILSFAHAQVQSTDPLTVSISPDYPRPYDVVTVTPDSTVFDLSASTVTFSVNGTVVQKGTGTESATVGMGGPGSVTKITVSAVNNGQTYSKTITIRPADVALVLEPNSTTHPFYEGASLVGSEGRLRIIAIPDLRDAKGVQIPASQLVYTWKNGDQVLKSDSGIGKSILIATAPVRFRDTVVTLTVSSQDSSVVGQASILISPVDPQVIIYQNHPLLGPRYETALNDSVTISGTEDTYRAVPYFFTSLPTITWEVNGTPSQTGQDITLRSSGNGQGAAVVNATADSGELGQSAAQQLSVQFGKASSGLFGL
jgi:hypothetical protein